VELLEGNIMPTTNFFTESQAQFTESQKKLSELWSESQKQLIESQKKLIYTWIDSSRGENTPTSFPENFEKALGFQRELVNSSLEAEKVITNLAIETQKQLWDSYFQATKKTTES
jgi:hypothetical protein